MLSAQSAQIAGAAADENYRERLVSSTITPLRFTGLSTFSEDFQSILTRAAQVAALPVKQLQNQQADLITKKQSLTALGTSVQGLGSAISTLADLGESRSLSATSSNTSVAVVSLNGAATPTSYTITDVTSVASRASETTVSGFADADTAPVDADGLLELEFGGTTYSIDLTATGKNNLNGLRDAINGLGLGVTASIIDTGSGATPQYLSLTATSPGATSLELRTTAGSSPSNLLTNTNQGTNAKFKLNGLQVEKSDNVISDVVPGLTFTITGTTDPGESVVLNLTSSRGGLANALSGLVTAYNAAVDKVKTQIGENAGLLSGDYIVGQVRRTLSQVAGYNSGSGDVKSLVDLGIELDKNGVMSFNSTKFYSLPTATIDAGFAFLGSATTGFGSLASKLDEITNPITGLIRTQQNNYDVADRRISSTITDLVARIEQSQATLSFKLQQADALLNSLQGQQSILTGAIESLNVASFGKRS